MKILMLIATMWFGVASFANDGCCTSNSKGAKGRCSGNEFCSACKNCSGCKHCAKEGGTCGVCYKPAPKPKPKKKKKG